MEKEDIQERQNVIQAAKQKALERALRQSRQTSEARIWMSDWKKKTSK